MRAGAALVLAGLVADGETVVHGGEHIDRGYTDLAATCGLSAPTSNASTDGETSATCVTFPRSGPVFGRRLEEWAYWNG